jgi:hypothetical protein
MSMLEDYKRDGFVVAEGVVEMDELPPLDSEAVMREHLRILHGKSIDAYLKTVRLIGRDVAVMAVFCAPMVRDLVKELGVRHQIMQTSPAVHIMAEDLKIPGGYDGVGAHQDWPAIQSGLDTVVAWFPFFDVGLDNYPVELAPGSHKLGLLPAVAGQHISAVDDTGMEFVPVPVKRGDMLLFSAFTVHRTRTQGQGFRIAFSHRYENAAEPTFAARGFPCAQSRVINRELVTPGFPKAEQVREVFA